MDPNESGGVQIETKNHLEAPHINAKEPGDFSVEGETQTKQQVQETLQSTGQVQNGE